MKGAVSREDLVESGALIPGGGVTGLVEFGTWMGYGIRKGRTARRVRRCLRREGQRVDASLRAQGMPTGDVATAWSSGPWGHEWAGAE